jgi:hypothetical protein
MLNEGQQFRQFAISDSRTVAHPCPTALAVQCNPVILVKDMQCMAKVRRNAGAQFATVHTGHTAPRMPCVFVLQLAMVSLPWSCALCGAHGGWQVVALDRSRRCGGV